MGIIEENLDFLHSIRVIRYKIVTVGVFSKGCKTNLEWHQLHNMSAERTRRSPLQFQAQNQRMKLLPQKWRLESLSLLINIK